MREKIIIEASKLAREAIDKGALSASDIASIVTEPVPPVSKFFEKNTGVEVGRHVGEPQAGAEFGREGAIGAYARRNPEVAAADVYTPKNIISRALHGAVPGAIAGGLVGAIAGGAEGAKTGALLGAGLLGVANAAYKPLRNYMQGKLHGSPTVVKTLK